MAEIMRSPSLQRPGVAIPSDDRAQAIVTRLALSPVPDIIRVVQQSYDDDRVPQNRVPQSRVPRVETREEGTPEQGTPSFDELAAMGRPAFAAQVRPMILCQDVHTSGEELLYIKMWGRGVKVGDHPYRVLTIGIKRLTVLVGLSKTGNCKNNLEGLIEKLAVDDLGVAPNPNDGHVYRIWEQGAILQRRRQRGLTHFIRERRGVSLVKTGDPEQGIPLSITRDPEQGTLLSKEGHPLAGKTGYPLTGSLYRNSEEDVCTASPSELVVNALLRVMGDSDDEAARRIIAATRQARQNLPDEVIVQLIEMKGPRIRASRQVQYPLRVLEVAVREAAAGVTGTNLYTAWRRTRERRTVTVN